MRHVITGLKTGTLVFFVGAGGMVGIQCIINYLTISIHGGALNLNGTIYDNTIATANFSTSLQQQIDDIQNQSKSEGLRCLAAGSIGFITGFAKGVRDSRQEAQNQQGYHLQYQPQ